MQQVVPLVGMERYEDPIAITIATVALGIGLIFTLMTDEELSENLVITLLFFATVIYVATKFVMWIGEVSAYELVA